MNNPPTYFGAKPNPLFTEEQTVLVRFVRFNRSVACGHCKRMSKTHWTSLVPFRALDMDDRDQQPNPFVIDTKRGVLLMPLTPVCRKHILAEDPHTMNEMITALRAFCGAVLARLKTSKSKEAAK